MNKMEEKITKEQGDNFFAEIKEKKIQKFVGVGFTREQAELLAEELEMTGFGVGSLF